MRPEAVPIYLGDHEKECPMFIRADQYAECPTCGEAYRRHQLYSWGDPNFLLYLIKTCDGRFWKL